MAGVLRLRRQGKMGDNSVGKVTSNPLIIATQPLMKSTLKKDLTYFGIVRGIFGCSEVSK